MAPRESLTILFLVLASSICNLVQSFSVRNGSWNLGELSESPIAQSSAEHHEDWSRRKFLIGFTTISASAVLSTLPSRAQDEIENVYKRSNSKNKFGYSLTLPPSFTESNKPLQTHLDEINLSDPNIKGYQIGITVDPIRIKSLKDFGTPDEVAAKIVMAELNRDGILDVTLRRDATEDESGAYGE